MIRERGRVVAIESDSVWLETIRKSTCGSCAAQKGCGHGLLNKMDAGRSHHVRALLHGLPASAFAIDDEVEIGIPEHVLVQGALLMYMLPLLCMLAGAIAANAIWASDVAAFLGSLGGLSTGFALVRYRAFSNRDNIDQQPTVVSAPVRLLPLSPVPTDSL